METLIEEAKKGILTVSDFYKDEIYNYFLAQSIINILIGLALTIVSLVVWPKLYKKDWFKDEYGIDTGGILASVVLGMCLIIGVVSFFCGMHDIIMLKFSPKIFITKEIVGFFKH